MGICQPCPQCSSDPRAFTGQAFGPDGDLGCSCSAMSRRQALGTRQETYITSPDRNPRITAAKDRREILYHLFKLNALGQVPFELPKTHSIGERVDWIGSPEFEHLSPVVRRHNYDTIEPEPPCCGGICESCSLDYPNFYFTKRMRFRSNGF